MNIDKPEIDRFTQRVQGMHVRLINLYQSINNTPIGPDILPQALVELGRASEMVKIATQELHQQNEQLIETHNLLEAERQRYQNLFELAPDAYLVTDIPGIIQEANRAASQLLNVPQQRLVGKPIVNYIALPDRATFRSFLLQVNECDGATKSTLCWQKSNGKVFDAAMTVGVVCNEIGMPIALRWLLRDITEQRNLQAVKVSEDNFDLTQGRERYKYSKGETIPLNSSTIWCVHQGLIKLSTLCDTGEEVLVGLAGQGMIFGSSLTALHTYQAIALSDVELVSIDLAEIATSSKISKTIISKINQRLRQTESFLVISGRRKVQDRFHYLLQLLKQEIGQSVAEGTRLNVRLTHQDLAGACCTTRVTMTRLLRKLQQQGKVNFDSKHHIIIRE
ncbi:MULTISPECIES: PAS domain S-box protein [Nostocales]|uniref:Transcriptional regulator n=4 Tax=Nostocales TaxID=1161 RepID=A0A0C1R1D0_9CYAN|nr:PAS domain S-box protein [Tolypothrix bouteillei]